MSIRQMPPGSTLATVKPLPPALRQSALQRLAFVMRVMAGVLLLSEALHWVGFFFADERKQLYSTTLRATLLVLTLVVERSIAQEKRSPSFRLALARGWMVAFSLTIAFLEAMDEPQAAGISRVCLAVALAPVLIPDSLPRSLKFSAGLFCTIPLGYALAWLGGQPVASGSTFLMALLSNLLAVGGAWVVAATVNQLRQQIAEQFGSYKLVARIGSGGYGEVWEASHRHLRRSAAIKLIKAELQDPVALERFWREAATLSNLECAHTVRLFDYGMSEDGSLYLVMELLRGLTLEALVERHGAVPEARAVALLKQVCLSLEEAHGQGLIHRDIKPANLFVGLVGGEPDFMKVLDFGLAKALGGAATNLTQDDQMVGTPEYMSPEQFGTAPPDGRSDIYSLGCVAYFLLTGSSVFAAGNVGHLIMQHLSGKPELPSQRLGRSVNASLESVILSCLEKEPAKRPCSARALFEQLNELPAWGRSEALEWWGQHPMLEAEEARAASLEPPA